MLSERVAVRAGDRGDRPLERGIVERVHLAAASADEVMVVLAARLRRLEAREPLAEVDPVDELELGELVERAVDARDADAAAFRAEAVQDLLRRHAARLAGEVRDHRLACRARAAPDRRSASWAKVPHSILIMILIIR